MPEKKIKASLGSLFRLKRVGWSKEGSIKEIFSGHQLIGAGALINLCLCLDAIFSSTEQYSIKKYQILVKLVTTKH
jgi:hypothetical protein